MQNLSCSPIAGLLHPAPYRPLARVLPDSAPARAPLPVPDHPDTLEAGSGRMHPGVAGARSCE